jgi:hypothetical protein
MPYGFEVFLGIKEYGTADFLDNALMGRTGSPGSPQRQDNSFEEIHPGAHAFDGSYTSLFIKWRGVELSVQSAVSGENLYLYIEPESIPLKMPLLIAGTGVLWNSNVVLKKEEKVLSADMDGKKVIVRSTAEEVSEKNVPCRTPYLSLPLNSPLAVYTGKELPLNEIKKIISRKKSEYEKEKESFGNESESFEIIRISQSWNMIYDPGRNYIISTVSRIWNVDWGGWVQHCWDTFFSGYMASLGSRETAYSNIISMLKNAVPEGFVPNCAAASGFKTLDRSQPPVGSFCVKEVYRKFREIDFIDSTFNSLYIWNTWFFENRRTPDGYMCWGSEKYEPVVGSYWEKAGPGDIYGAAMESGMDNSPLYDNVPLNPENGCMELADAGLMSLYIWDTLELMKLARLSGKENEYIELEQRAEIIFTALELLWDEESGIYLNKRIDTGEFSKRISPVNMYPLLTGKISRERAERIINEHFYNPEEFFGEWILPGISRNDPAYPEQDYWRGRIWPPHNFLVYIGLRNYSLKKEQRILAEKSRKLVYKEWFEKGHIHENYSAETGDGCGVDNSDPFLNWGALLAMIPLIEYGYIEAPENTL